MKRIFALIMHLICITPLLAQTLTGKCGDHLNYSLEISTGTLKISGSGNMDDFEWNKSPWATHAGAIFEVILPDGLTSIGANAFVRTGVSTVSIPKGVKKIGSYAFCECIALTSINIPEGTTELGASAFQDCI